MQWSGFVSANGQQAHFLIYGLRLGINPIVNNVALILQPVKLTLTVVYAELLLLGGCNQPVA